MRVVDVVVARVPVVVETVLVLERTVVLVVVVGAGATPTQPLHTRSMSRRAREPRTGQSSDVSPRNDWTHVLRTALWYLPCCSLTQPARSVHRPSSVALQFSLMFVSSVACCWPLHPR